MTAQEKFENVEEMFKDAEGTFRKGIGTLSAWNEQARELIDQKPGVILAALGVSGFVTGALVRHALSGRKSGLARKLPADPLLLFGSGIAAGLLAGPRLIEEALHRLEQAESGEKVRELDGARLYSTAPMNEKPFERT